MSYTIGYKRTADDAVMKSEYNHPACGIPSFVGGDLKTFLL
ncbi:MAG: hypothetical protein ACK5MG_09050 [Bacteroidales bacterium]